MTRDNITVWQGLAKYATTSLGKVSLEGKKMGDMVGDFKMSTIEAWKLKDRDDGKGARIPRFTLKLPGITGKDTDKDIMAFCEKLDSKNEKDKEILDKIDNKDPKWPMVAEIGKEGGTTKIKFYKICEDVKEIKCDGTPIGYIKITVSDTKGTYEHFFTFKLESIKPESMKENPDCVIAFVDGSSGGINEDTGRENKFEFDDGTSSGTSEDTGKNKPNYQAYGGAYMLYRPGEAEAFCKSWEREKEKKDENRRRPEKIEPKAIEVGLMGVSEGPGNVNGEINSAIRAIKKADEMGVKKIRLYYDCEQIGGHVPEIGVFNNHDTTISLKYVRFWQKGLEEKDDDYKRKKIIKEEKFEEYKTAFEDQGFKEFKNLKEIELIHVDAHTKPEFTANDGVDIAAKNVRDDMMTIFEFLWDNSEKYKKTE